MNPAPADSADRGDISKSMAEFYRRVFTGELLGPVFLDVARVDLAVYLPGTCEFWADGAAAYRFVPAQRGAASCRPHLQDPPRPSPFTGWLSPWTAVVDARHTGGTAAELARYRAASIAGAISRRLYGRSLGELPTTQIKPPDQRLP